MSDEKAKVKNVKRLPLGIQFSVIISYFSVSIVCSLILWVLIELGFTIDRSVSTALLVPTPPILGFFVGWWLKFRYVHNQGDDQQQLRVKAQFWGALAFLVAFVISILLIMIVLIMLESNALLPKNAADPIAFILAMIILALSFVIANNTKKRIYRNFGYAS